MMQPLLTELLNLPGIEVENYTDCGGQLILEVEAMTTQAICPRCQQVSGHLHQNHWYLALVFKHQWTDCVFEGESSPIQVSNL